MTPAETKFKQAVVRLHKQGIAPTPTNILNALEMRLHRMAGGPMLSGRQGKWRCEVLTELGYRKNPISGRWDHPNTEFARDLRAYEATVNVGG